MIVLLYLFQSYTIEQLTIFLLGQLCRAPVKTFFLFLKLPPSRHIYTKRASKSRVEFK